MTHSSSESTAFIIEDDPDLVGIFAEALALSGYQTTSICDGQKALELLSEFVPDVVVLDLHLPGVSGSELLSVIREDGRLSNTRVILATADYRTAEELRDTADLVLLKPISFKQLRDLSARLRLIQERAKDEANPKTATPQTDANGL
jgi:DNA-binding response OmpR family regulator